jgi:hypothetical protein
MNTTKKQWVTPIISDMDLDSTQSGPIAGPLENGESHT